MYDVVVVGGGLAGCSAAAQLSMLGHRVLLIEKQLYPTHKLCGEFLSIEVTDAFRRLGALDAVRQAGPAAITRTVITVPGGAAYHSELPGTALGLSRYRLDHLLAEHAACCGSEVRDGERVTAIEGSLAEGFTVETDGGGSYAARAVLGAYGKRSALDRKLDRPFFSRSEPFVAFKAHYRGVDLEGAVELHAFQGGYCGLSHVEEGLINACWITHQDALRDAGGSPEGMIAHTFRHNPRLRARFERMQRVSDDVLAISQISFAGKAKFDCDVCMIGDAGGMITPLCGDGMAMALRSAELAAPLVSRFLSGALTADAFKQVYERAWRREFRRRMAVGRIVHHGFVRSPIARIGLAGLNAFPRLGHWLIHNTRG